MKSIVSIEGTQRDHVQEIWIASELDRKYLPHGTAEVEIMSGGCLWETSGLRWMSDGSTWSGKAQPMPLWQTHHRKTLFQKEKKVTHLVTLKLEA
jgi:hypothetical protein